LPERKRERHQPKVLTKRNEEREDGKSKQQKNGGGGGEKYDHVFLMVGVSMRTGGGGWAEFMKNRLYGLKTDIKNPGEKGEETPITSPKGVHL